MASKKSNLVCSLIAALVAVFLMAAPAFAGPGNDQGNGQGQEKKEEATSGSSEDAPGNSEGKDNSAKDNDGDADSDSGTAYTEDNDTNDGGTPNNVEDDGDNAHPSGKDRSVENGNSGNQGKSESDPDDDGRGPDRSNGGPDKPNGSGGDDLADQDGNNGCGNDDDFEDDNEGHCGGKVKDEQFKPKNPSNPGGGSQGGNVPCPSGTRTFKIDANPGNGTFSDGTLVVTISNSTGTSFSWASNLSVQSVIVKGGPTSKLNGGGMSGFAVSPNNPNSGGLYGISHVSFCYLGSGDNVGGGELPCDADATMPGTQPCDNDDKKITICHATGSMTNPYVIITISVNGLNGHGKHEGDIIPAPAGGCPGPDDEVLPTDPEVREDDAEPDVLSDQIDDETTTVAAERPATRVLGAVLPFTGASILSFLGAALGLIAAGLLALRSRKTS